MTDRDVKRLSDIMYMLGDIEGECDKDYITDYCETIASYIKELFIKVHGIEPFKESDTE